MIPHIVIMVMMLNHWVADFIFQTDHQAQNKSKSNWALFKHVFTYTLSWTVVGLIFGYTVTQILQFSMITFVTHFATDYLTSRLNTYLYNKKQIHNFFVSVGFDQWLHLAQLVMTYHYVVGFKYI